MSEMKSGIDVSSHQGAIQWEKVKTDFAILRAGWSWYDGGMDTDARFRENIKGVQASGIPWGVYLYAYDRTPEAARIAARKLAKLLEGRQLAYPVAYDFEDNQYLNFSKEDNTAICKAFLEEMESLGFYVTLYTYANFANSYLNMADLARWDFWVAAYQNPLTSWKGDWGIWQYSSTGKVDGISTNVDLNHAQKDYPSIIQGAGLNGFSAGEAPVETVPRAEYDALKAKHEALVAAIQRALEAV
jgi:lysozyme